MAAPESKVSVIIPTRNSVAMLKRTVACLENQSLPKDDYEVTIVNDGSTDGTAQFLRDYRGSLNLKAVHLKACVGRGAARNAGIRDSSGKTLIFIDGDLEFGENFVDGHIKNHSNQEQVIVGRVVYQSCLGRRGWAQYLQTRGAVKLPEGAPVPGRYLLSGNCSLRRSTVEAVGGFDESLNFYGEDLDFGLRLEKLSIPIRFDKSLVVSHLHIRSLREALRLTYDYGLHSVPRLIDKHPELRNQLRLDWAEAAAARGAVRRALLSRPIWWIFFGLGSLLNEFWAPAALYDYLVFSSYYRGFKAASKQEAGEIKGF